MSMVSNYRFAILVIVLILGIGYLHERAGGQNPVPPVSSPAVVYSHAPYYAMPERMDLCGEAIPLQDQDVRERFDREFMIVVYGHAQLYLWLKRAERYFPWIEKELAGRGLPDDLKYVAVAESDLMVSATSPAGAAGPWQFIPSTGSNYGLNQTKEIDERRDFELATASAFQYLGDLRNLFQNWTLAIAAYNCGERRVQDEMRKQKVTNYYSLKLPQETERYIFRIAAIKEVLTHPEKYGYSLPKGAGYPPLRVERTGVNLTCPVPVQMVAEAAGMTYREFKSFNPCFVSDTIPQGAHTIKAPEGKGRELPNRIRYINENYRPTFVAHKISKGDTLSSVAAQYDVSVQDLKEWNHLGDDTVRIGQSLRILRP
jgi:soluble lytic murein transglycosylase-like protein